MCTTCRYYLLISISSKINFVNSLSFGTFIVRDIIMSSCSGSGPVTRGLSSSRYPSRPTTSRGHTTSRSRPRTVATSTGYVDNEIICAISESRGISPTVGLSFVNLSTSEAVLCQFTDTQTYARTCHKIKVFAPSEILYMSTAADSKLISIVMENLDVERANILMTSIDRKYWSESSGHDYVQHLAFPDDLESLKLSISGSYFAICCFSAVCSGQR
jgi:DNA mismatch repair protein MSH4